ncbi:MAG TPA: hypothetical protein VK147_08430 [Candidatus Didemnitutus sp.]|nr:hypothetical protein [Candidatus Didemnitutus sp.]
MEHLEVQRAPLGLVKFLGWTSGISTLFVALTVLIVAHDSGDRTEALTTILIVVAAQLFVFIPLFRVTRLIVRVNDQGVFVRLRPFQIKGRFIPWTEILHAVIRPVRPIGEFGGWGIRWDLGKKTGYIWNGEQALELFLTNGKVVVITIMDVKGARQAVNSYVTPRNTL